MVVILFLYSSKVLQYFTAVQRRSCIWIPVCSSIRIEINVKTCVWILKTVNGTWIIEHRLHCSFTDVNFLRFFMYLHPFLESVWCRSIYPVHTRNMSFQRKCQDVLTFKKKKNIDTYTVEFSKKKNQNEYVFYVIVDCILCF